MENSESARFESRGCRHTYTEHTHGIPAIRYGQVRHGRKTRNAASTMRSDAPSAPSSRPITHSVCPRKSFDGEPKRKKKKKNNLALIVDSSVYYTASVPRQCERGAGSLRVPTFNRD